MFNIRFGDLSDGEARQITGDCPLVAESPGDYTEVVRQVNGMLDGHYCPRDLDMLIWIVAYLHQQRKCPDQAVSHPVVDCLRTGVRFSVLCELGAHGQNLDDAMKTWRQSFSYSEKDLGRILDNRFQTLLACALLSSASTGKGG